MQSSPVRRDGAAIQDSLQQRSLVTVIGDRGRSTREVPPPWLALPPKNAVEISQAFTRAHPNWMQSWGLTEADLADEWAWRRACGAKISRLAMWSRGDQVYRAQPEPRAFTWTLSTRWADPAANPSSGVRSVPAFAILMDAQPARSICTRWIQPGL